MAISIINKPFPFSPVFNPIEFDMEETSPWTYVDYYPQSYDENYFVSGIGTFRKANVYNDDYFKINLESLLQDLMDVKDPLPELTTLTPSGLGWCRKYGGVVAPNSGGFIFLPNLWAFNGSLSKNDWIDAAGATGSQFIPNETLGTGRFLSEFTDRVVQDESIGTSAVTNGQFEEQNERFFTTEYRFTDYHNISFRNNNSSGLFDNTFLKVYDDNFNTRWLQLKVFPGAVGAKLAVGDIINYSTDPASQVFTYYGTTLNREWTIGRVVEFSNATLSLYLVEIKVEDTVPTTNAITSGALNELTDIGTSTLVLREWAYFNKYFESSYYVPDAYEGTTPVISNRYQGNKKLTIPTYPTNLRKAMGKRYISTSFKSIGVFPTLLTFIMLEEHNYEVGDEVYNLIESTDSSSTVISLYWKMIVVDVTPTEVTVLYDFTLLNSFFTQGTLWSPTKDGLLKKVRRYIPGTLFTDLSTGKFSVEFKAKNLVGLPDQFLITLESGGPTYSIPTEMIVDNVEVTGMTTENSNIYMQTRTLVDYLPDLTAGEKTIIAGSTYPVTVCVHHNFASNAGYTPVLNYDGSFTDPYYNNPANSDYDYYEVDMEKILKANDYRLLNTADNRLTFRRKKLCTKYDKINIMWLNSYGAYDYATFDWMKRQEREYERETYRKTSGKWVSGSYVYSKGDKELTDYHITRDTIGTINSDWVSETEYNRLLEILETPSVYMWEGTYYLPIVIEMDTIEEKTLKNDKVFNLTLSYRVTNNKNSIRI